MFRSGQHNCREFVRFLPLIKGRHGFVTKPGSHSVALTARSKEHLGFTSGYPPGTARRRVDWRRVPLFEI
jgi:hypothetical protein